MKFTSNWLYMPFLALPSIASLTGAITTSVVVVGAGLAERPLVTKWVVSRCFTVCRSIFCLTC